MLHKFIIPVAADSIPLPCHLILLMYFEIEAVPLFVFVFLTKKFYKF